MMASSNSYFIRESNYADLYDGDLTFEKIIAAAWLHDVIEDCDDTYNNMIYDLDETGVVLALVEGLTNTTIPTDGNRMHRIKLDHLRISKQNHIIRMLKAMDILDNVSDMDGADKGFLLKYLDETHLLIDALTSSYFPDTELMLDLQQEVTNQREMLEIPF